MDVQVGDRVAVPFILSCGNCRECARSRPTICEKQEQPGFTMPGSFAEFVAIPRADRNLCTLPDKVSHVRLLAFIVLCLFVRILWKSVSTLAMIDPSANGIWEQMFGSTLNMPKGSGS